MSQYKPTIPAGSLVNGVVVVAQNPTTDPESVSVQSCGFCKYFKQTSRADQRGSCRIYPSPMIKSHDDWCGQFNSL